MPKIVNGERTVEVPGLAAPLRRQLLVHLGAFACIALGGMFRSAFALPQASSQPKNQKSAPPNKPTSQIARKPLSKRGVYVIAKPCIGTKDTACVDACPVDCIHPKKDEHKFAKAMQLYIDPVECIDCGACLPACPVSAIFALEDLPEKWAQWAQKNATFFGR